VKQLNALVSPLAEIRDWSGEFISEATECAMELVSPLAEIGHFPGTVASYILRLRNERQICWQVTQADKIRIGVQAEQQGNVQPCDYTIAVGMN
jgi:hypothetical protein